MKNRLNSFMGHVARGVVCIALVTLIGCDSCTDAPSNPNSATLMPDDRMKMKGGMPPPDSVLEHVDVRCRDLMVCQDDVSHSSGRKLRVRLIDGMMQLAANVNIKYTLEMVDLPGGVTLSATNAVTDEQGIAEVDLRAGMTNGVAQVTVSTDDPNVNTLRFLVSINPKDASSFNVELEQIGATNVSKADVFLFDKNTSCETFLNDARSLSAEFNKQSLALGDNTLPPVKFSPVPNGTTYTVGVKAYERADDRVEVSMGCMPGTMNPAIENGMPATVTVPLIKHIPYMVGSYEVLHTFSLIDAFPPNMARIINLIGTLVTDQGAFIIGCGSPDPNTGELMATADCPVPTAGIAKLLVDFLPDGGALGQLKETIESFLESSFAREVARATINDAVQNFINTNGNVPGWVKNSVNITADVYANLRNFRVNATLRVNEQPQYIVDAQGLPMVGEHNTLTAVWSNKSNEHLWNNITVFWRRGCDENAPADCGENVNIIPMTVSEGDAVEGTWDGTLVGGNALIINEHALSFNYGTFVLQLLEALVLPQLFGDDSINSVEAALDEFINCDSLAERIADAVNFNAIEGIFSNLCVQLKGQATDALRGYVAGLVFEGDDRFTVQVPAEKPCALSSPDPYPTVEWTENGYPLPYIEALGEETPNQNKVCHWDVNVRLAADNQPVVVSGTWTGVLND